jgi:RimJ/RimL family protein N-acetyltransferase
MEIEPVTLEGTNVRLEPLSLDHLPRLCEVGLDEELWRLTTTQISTPAELQAYLEVALRDQEAGTALPFVTLLKNESRVIGSTRFGNIDKHNRKLEIGWTWIGTPWQRSVVNTEAKYLMLRHAFEKLHCVRVELKTDSLNERSRNAILRIGAKEEGTFRNHMITQGGRLRHSVFFSIIESEWPAVKASLEAKLSC